MLAKINKYLLIISVIGLIFASSLYASDRFSVRRNITNSCSHHVSQQIVKYPHYVQEQVYYFVGQPLRIESLLRIEQKDEEYAEFKAWKAAKLKQNYIAKVTKENNCEHCNKVDTPPTESVPTEPELPRSPTNSLYAQKCSSCHSGATPKGQLTLTADTFINFDQYKKAVKHIDAGTMPKGGPPLTEAESNYIKSELLKLVQ